MSALCEVVGIVGDERVSSFDDRRLTPLVYVSIEQKPSAAKLVIRGASDPSVMEATLRAAVASVDRDQALSDVKTVAQLKAEIVTPDRFRSALLAGFAVVALLLAAVGIYGVMSYSVRQRHQEMGIRSALGATPRNLMVLVVRGGMGLALVGVAIGSAAALATGRLLAAFLFGVSPRRHRDHALDCHRDHGRRGIRLLHPRETRRARESVEAPRRE